MRRVSLFLLILSLLAGCAMPSFRPTPKTPPKPPDYQAVQLHMRGDYFGAAQAYLNLAIQTQDAVQRQNYQLRAAELLIRGNQVGEAKRWLLSLGTPLTADLGARRQLALAEVEVMEGQTEQALRRLQALPAETLGGNLRPIHHRIQAQALERNGRYFEAAQMRAYLDSFLQNLVDLNNNHQMLWQDLQQVPVAQLTPAADAAADAWNGWLSLAALMQTTHPQYRQQALEHWRTRYPQHPALRTIAAPPSGQAPGQDAGPLVMTAPSRTAPEGNAGYRGFKPHIALLLPLNGNYRAAAETVRDGFFAAWYSDNQNQRPILRVYDTGIGDIGQIYSQALNQGANLVVGPLHKDLVTRLAASLGAQASVPTLALNVLQPDNGVRVPANFYQFGLSPENEAREVAKWMWEDGRRTVAALVPEGEWGRRMLAAFSTQWQYLGGQLADYRTYTDKDIAGPVRQVVAHKSYLDAVFVGANPVQARRIKPQFRYYLVPRLPLYATSRIYTGTPDPTMDHDLNTMLFVDMPWRLYEASVPVKL